MIRKAPLPLRQQISPSSKGSQSITDRGSGQAYNLIAKEAVTFEEVIIGKITVHSKPVLALFDSGASYCYISDSFIVLHLFLLYV